jgi:hypothetical protein
MTATMIGTPLEVQRDVAIDAFQFAMMGNVVSLPDMEAIAEGLLDVRVRDTVLWNLANYDQDVDLFLGVLTNALALTPAGKQQAPVLTMIALGHWLNDDIEYAKAFSARALLADPEYSLLALVIESIIQKVPGSMWLDMIKGLSFNACRNGGK